jgi:HD-GYP domain-containing protein (c-di-GMP phosphodiesterase class II)
MHKAFLSDMAAGQRLAKSLYTNRGDVLLARDNVLTDRLIDALRGRGHSAVHVLDGVGDGVEPTDIISAHIRRSTMLNLKQLFGLMARISRPVGKHPPGVLREVGVELDVTIRDMLLALYRSAESILDEVIDAETLNGLSELKRHDEYTFEHSIDVAVYGTMLGQRLDMRRSELRELAIGCLLHDIGKIHIDPRIITKPGPLTPTEFDQIKQHPLLGYAMVREMPTETSRPAHIVLQHHERQDGSGYPHGLVGTNRIARTERERFDARRILLLTELTSVADMYGALASDRPYRATLPPDQIIALLRSDAGPHLNRDVVRTFLSIVQVYPVGLHVRLVGGEADGCTAVVTQVTAGAPNRPRVKLVADRSGKPLDGPELNLHRLPDDIQLFSVQAEAA